MRLLAALWAVACLALSVLAMAIPEDTAIDIPIPHQPTSEQGIVYKISADRGTLTISSANGSFINQEVHLKADTPQVGVAGYLYHLKGLRGDQYPLDLSNETQEHSAQSVIVSHGYVCMFFRACQPDFTQYRVFTCNNFVGDFKENICSHHCEPLGPLDQCYY